MTHLHQLKLALGVAVLVCGTWTNIAAAQQTTQPETLSILQGRPDVAPATASTPTATGRRFESRTAGIAFEVPVGLKQIGGGPAEQIARFASEDGARALVLTRIVATAPTPLVVEQGDDADDDDDGGAGSVQRPRRGMLDIVTDRLIARDPSADVLGHEVTTIGKHEVGLITARTSQGLQRVLSQQVLIPITSEVYYLLTYTAPASRDVEHGATVPADDGERAAQDVLRMVGESIELLDLSALKDEQDQRLFRTRAFYVQLEPREIHAILVPERWMRITKDGQDVGYARITEVKEPRGEQDGVRVEARSVVTSADANPTEARASYWMSTDRASEVWQSLTTTSDGPGVRGRSEVGQSEREQHYVRDDQAPVGDADDPNNPPMRQVETYVLKVRHMVREPGADWVLQTQPIERDLPPFYLPEALHLLLPRLVPLADHKTYLFASYVGERKEIMLRYVDVGQAHETTLDGQRVTAIPVTERIGYDGPVTTHWMSPEGQWIGTSSSETGLTMLPSDADTIRQRFPEADQLRVSHEEHAP